MKKLWQMNIFSPIPGSSLACWEVWAWWRVWGRIRGEELQLFRPVQSLWSALKRTGHRASKSRPLAPRTPWWQCKGDATDVRLVVMTLRRAGNTGHWVGRGKKPGSRRKTGSAVILHSRGQHNTFPVRIKTKSFFFQMSYTLLNRHRPSHLMKSIWRTRK